MIASTIGGPLEPEQVAQNLLTELIGYGMIGNVATSFHFHQQAARSRGFEHGLEEHDRQD